MLYSAFLFFILKQPLKYIKLMKIKLTNFKARAALSALSSLEEMDIDITVGHKLGIMQLTLVDYVEKFEEKHQKLMLKYAEKDKDGNPLPVKDKDGNIQEGRIQINNVEKMAEDISKLGNSEIEVDFPVELKIDDFSENDVKIKMKTVRDLSPLIST